MSGRLHFTTFPFLLKTRPTTHLLLLLTQGIAICRSKDDLEEMCQIKALALAKLDAAARLGMRAGDLMG